MERTGFFDTPVKSVAALDAPPDFFLTGVLSAGCKAGGFSLLKKISSLSMKDCSRIYDVLDSQIEKMLPESAERLPATKYLNQYMALFIWLWQHKGLPLADKEWLLKRTIADSYDYAENYDKIKVRPMDINTKGAFPQVV